MTGDHGSGKSALLCNLVSRLKQDKTYDVVYHFIGFAEGSTGICILFPSGLTHKRKQTPFSKFAAVFRIKIRLDITWNVKPYFQSSIICFSRDWQFKCYILKKQSNHLPY